MAVLAAETSQPAGLLREVAIMLERYGEIDVLIVKYEKLVLDPQVEFLRIFGFLNLDCSLSEEQGFAIL